MPSPTPRAQYRARRDRLAAAHLFGVRALILDTLRWHREQGAPAPTEREAVETARARNAAAVSLLRRARAVETRTTHPNRSAA